MAPSARPRPMSCWPIRPLPLQAAFLHPQLKSAAQAVGLTRALCMVDFILQANELVFLEIAPRPGGDCPAVASQ